ncbi:uncharacterized protein LOC116427622 [Nomia melanderi]|uniref:uncharacterized protein LOC116427622 n=1 Tax=Nomia melanderi TaxID=2448451 RepID=UPI003FCE70F8
MSQSTAPLHPSENTGVASSTEKIAMSTTGNKGIGTAQRNKASTNPIPRNTTHKEITDNTTDDASSSTRSQNNSARRSPVKPQPAVSPTAHRRPSSSTSAASSAMKFEKQYLMKKNRFQLLRKDLIDKQKLAQNLYNELSQLREKVIASGTKDPGKLDDLKIEIGSPKQVVSPVSVVQNDQEDTNEDKLPIGSEYVERLERQLQNIPQKTQDLCLDILNKQTELVAFVTAHLKPDTDESEGDNINVELTTQLEMQQRDYEKLQLCLEEAAVAEAKTIAEIVMDARDMIEKYEANRTKQKELKKVEDQKKLQSQLTSTVEELQMEKEKNNQVKERLRQAESQLQKARAKIRELEAHAVNDEGKIQVLQTNLKNLDTQMKQKDQAMESKMKDMQKTLKSSEALIIKVEKQRDSFETRLFELKEKMSSKENDTMSTIKELSEKLDAVTCELGMEREKKQQIEEAFVELEERYRQLEEKCNQVCELAEKNKDFTITEGNHSENEVRLFNELQEAKIQLETQKQMTMQLQQEKEEIVAVMHQAANHDSEQDSREKLAAKLVLKTNEMKNLVKQYLDLKKIAKNAQEKSGTLEKQLAEIQARVQSQTKEGGKAGLSAQAIELLQEVSDLRNNLAEVIQQKEELEDALTKKQLELEQRDHVMREQSKFLKVRDELLDILKGKTEQQNGELSNSDENNEYIDQVYKQIALKTEAIQELYATLKSKQMQIMRLEKMVKLMEDQQDRAQAQRTRLENRIAQLEVALQRNKEQRGKNFIHL